MRKADKNTEPESLCTVSAFNAVITASGLCRTWLLRLIEEGEHPSVALERDNEVYTNVVPCLCPTNSVRVACVSDSIFRKYYSLTTNYDFSLSRW